MLRCAICHEVLLGGVSAHSSKVSFTICSAWPGNTALSGTWGLTLLAKEHDMPTLEELIELTRHIKMTPEQQAAQRRSFVYGNCRIENDLITREMVAEADERLKGQAAH